MPYGMLQTAFGASCINRASVFEWHKRFKESRESERDDVWCGRSKEVRTPQLIGQIKNFMDKDRHVSIETISTQFDVSVINSVPAVLDALVTCNESWIYCYDPETKRQSSQWKHAGSPRPKKARQSKSTHKLLIIPFFDITCMFYMHWVHTGQTDSQQGILC